MVLGIVSLILGTFFFIVSIQPTMLAGYLNMLSLSAFAQLTIGVCLLISGILSVVCAVRRDHKALLGCAIANLIATIIGFSYGGILIVRWLCALQAVYYSARYFVACTSQEPRETTETIIEEELLAQNHHTQANDHPIAGEIAQAPVCTPRNEQNI